MTLVEFSPSGGLFQFALQMADGLAEAGHAVVLVTGPRPELQPRQAAVTLLPILPTWHPAEGSTPPLLVRKLRRMLRAVRHLAAWVRVGWYLWRSRPDVVQWAEWRFAVDGLAVSAVAHLVPRTAMVVVAHTPRPFNEQRRRGSLYKTGGLLQTALGQAYRRMDLVLVLGEHSRAEFLAAFGEGTAARLEIIPHGDESIFAREPVPPADHAAPRVLFFGTLARYKGVNLLLDAFELVRREHPEAELVLAGAPADVDLRKLTQRAAAIGGVEVRVGYVAAPDVPGLFAAARLVVTPYLVANQSGVVHLAHTLARPVVATDVGDLGAVVRHGETGILVPPSDPVALSVAMEELLTDPALAARLGATGARRLARDSSWRTVAEQVTPLYQELVAARRSVSG